MPLWRSNLPNVNGWMEGPNQLNEHWRLATLYERIWYFTFQKRFTLVDWTVSTTIIVAGAVQGWELWMVGITLAIVLAIIVLIELITQPN
jgi:hypothetical protein